MRHQGSVWQRMHDEAAQAWAVAWKDIRVYYMTPPMIMFGLLLPFFLFFSFSIRRVGAAEESIARLLAMNVFFTASSAGPVIIPMERRARTYDRLLVAPMSLASLLLGKVAVGTFFALLVCVVSLVVTTVWQGAVVSDVALLLTSLVLSSLASAAFGLVFGSVPAQSVGSIMMPSTLVRWPLLFISGVFIPLQEMHPWLRPLAYLSPLTYTQDLLRYATVGAGSLLPLLDLAALAAFTGVFLYLAARLHHRSKELGY
jgi:ABC-2 type transport system permease protein